jgi:hypothetical protein
MVDLSAMEVHAAPRVFLAEEDKGVEDLILLSIRLDLVFLGAGGGGGTDPCAGDMGDACACCCNAASRPRSTGKGVTLP